MREISQATDCLLWQEKPHPLRPSLSDENILLSDYNLLEETKRVAEAAERLRGKLCGAASGFPYFKLPYNLRNLKNAAGSCRTKVLFLPTGMTRREKNQTQYNQRKKLILWTIEWRFHSTDVVLVDHGVHEDTTLYSFFIRKYPKKPKSPFRELDIKALIRQQLSNLVLLEYPIIYVFLPSHSFDFEVVKDSQPVTRRPMPLDPVSNIYESPKGPQNFNQDGMSEKVPNNFDNVDNGSPSSPTAYEPGVSEDMFDFDQGLIDAYSDLFAEIDPVDFLDFEGIFSKEADLDVSNLSGGYFGEEELEEGEI
ncbi:hypothetical protein LWI28_027898 [Acer negundo]|uniref:BCD1 alpha/beta domain-containing protein n=1 Tax=Acer negundo TaxID=4023 RepID=A0AAD5NKQ9_ACENE|nr:hypothetical protein LWI28_027898 [Acer negundo]